MENLKRGVIPGWLGSLKVHDGPWRCAPFGEREEELGPHLTQCGRAEAYLHEKFHLDPSNRLATIHQCYKQTGQTDNSPIAKGEPFYKQSPEN